jgi:hypothetical protein
LTRRPAPGVLLLDFSHEGIVPGKKLNLIKGIPTVFLLILLGSDFNPRNSVFIRNKKAGRDAKPVADLNGIRSITQTQRKYGKPTKNRNIASKNRTAGLFA